MASQPITAKTFLNGSQRGGDYRKPRAIYLATSTRSEPLSWPTGAILAHPACVRSRMFLSHATERDTNVIGFLNLTHGAPWPYVEA